jgi:hypothetical protein
MQAASKGKNPKSEIRNPKQIQIGGKGNEENGGGSLSANFANFANSPGGRTSNIRWDPEV